MGFQLDRTAFKKFAGFPDEAADEGYAEYAAMSPEQRVELVGFLRRRYLRGVLNAGGPPRMERVIRFCALGDGA